MYVNVKQTAGLTLIYQKAELTQFKSVKTKVAGRSYTCGCFQAPRRRLYPPCPPSSPPDWARSHSLLLWGQWSPGLEACRSHCGGVGALVPAPPATGASSPYCVSKSRNSFLHKPTPDETTELATLMLDLQQ